MVHRYTLLSTAESLQGFVVLVDPKVPLQDDGPLHTGDVHVDTAGCPGSTCHLAATDSGTVRPRSYENKFIITVS